jgi:long-chain acyl-CoA synthetase
MEYQSPLFMLQYWEKETPHKVYLKQPVNGVWYSWTWQQAGQEVRQLAAALQSLALPPNSHIALFSKNCAHWMICDLAIMMAGHVSIPLYPNLQQDTIQQALEHSDSVVLFAGKLDNWDAIKNGVPKHIKCIALPFCSHDGCESWSSFTKLHAPIQENIERNATDLCSIVYTSGTSGSPKGTMFTFDAFAFVAQNAIECLGFKHTDSFFSYLPLSHIAERMLVEMVSLYAGGLVSFADSLQTFAQDLRETKPTIFLGVHRIWTKFQEGLLVKIPQKKLDILLRVPVLSHFTKRKIRKGLGLNNTTMVLTGASPTPPALIEWFHRIGIRIQEAYAMTENCCYSHVTLKEKIKIGYVGKALPNCDVRLGDSNEIQVKHRGLMKGYYKEPDKTMDAFTKDGFLKTGDEGFIDEKGFLKITGRIKDLFKTAKGKYVAPSPIEMKFSANAIVEQVCVIGSGLPQPMALLTLSETGRKTSIEELHTELKNMLKDINSSLDAHEKVYKIIVLKEQWLVENNLLTPSLKIKRNEIEKRYAAFYENWFDTAGSIIMVDEQQPASVSKTSGNTFATLSINQIPSYYASIFQGYYR